MSEPSPEVAARLRHWQSVTLGTLFVGYMGYYVCRSNLSIATPFILAEYESQGLKKEHMGDIVSAGVLLYAVGKTINGVLTEYLGGRCVFLLGMFASAFCTILLALTPQIAPSLAPVSESLGLPVAFLLPMYIAWSLNRFVQSMGWGGLLQITARWIHASRMATVMGFLCMSYLLGDAIARAFLSHAMKVEIPWNGEIVKLNWQGLFYLSAGTLVLIGVVASLLLKSRPAVLGLPEPPPPPGNVFGDDRGEHRISPMQILIPLLTNFTFWLVCLMNVGLTMIRETFNFWIPTYLKEVAKVAPEDAGMPSVIFPLCGAMAALSCGWLVDRLGGRYGLVVISSLVLLVASLILLAFVPVEHDTVRAMLLISVVAFTVMGPYSFCSGVLAMNLGGQRAGATTSGIIDTMGYLGAVLSGSGIGRIAQYYGWSAAFLTLGGVAFLTLIVAGLYAARGRKS